MAAPHPALRALVSQGELPAETSISMTIAESAIEHGVAPLLDEAMESTLIEGDHGARVRLAMRRLECAAETESTSLAVGRLLDAAQALGIEIAIYKGLAIGVRWYPSPDLRPAVDIDVFINPAHVDRMGEFVESLTGRSDSRTAIDAMVAEGRTFEYDLTVNGVAIDLHVDPMNLVVLTRQRDVMWQRTEVVASPTGRPMRSLDLELSIVQSLVHLFHDNFADLLHIYDVALMMDNDPDWRFIESYIATEGWTDIVRFSLAVVSDTIGRPSPLPRDISVVNRILVAGIWPRRVRLKGSDSLARSHRRQTLVSFLVTGRRLDVFVAILRRAFPPRLVIDDRFPGCNCPYPIALLRWRLAQRSEIKHLYADNAQMGSTHPKAPIGTPATEESIYEAL